MTDIASFVRATARFTAAICAALAVAATLGAAARAQTCNTDLCTEPLTSTVYLNNNEYGNRNPVYGSQSITVNSPTAWSTSWSYSGAPVNYNIRSYGSAVLGWQYGWLDSGTGLPVALSSHTPVNTTCAYTVSGSTQWMDVSYDCWFHTVSNPGSSTPQSDEMMIWLADYGSLDPGTPAAVSNITIDGIAWDAYHGTAGSWNYVAWYPHGQTSWDLHGATLNITDFTDAAVNNGIINGSHYLTSVQFGTEIYNNGSGTLNVTNYTVSVGGGSAPPAPTGLSATAGNAQVALSWNASSGATAYDVKRSTVSGSGYATVSSPASTSYTNTGLTNGTTYYFVVDAKNSVGTSGNSNQASATPTSGGTSGVVSINCGGSAASPFIADADFGSGTKTFSVSNAITTTGVTNPAPQAVYQTERASDGSNGGAFTYTIPGLTANASYTVRLHFAEIFYNTGGSRSINVTINGTQVLTNYDIFNAAGGEFKANIQQFNTSANGSGQIAITFGGGGAKVDGIEILNGGGGSAPPAPANLSASAGSGQVALSWSASSGATAYDVKRSTVNGSGYAAVSSPTGTNYTNTGLTNGTTYYFVVDAKNANGTSGNSNQASATPTATLTPVIQINAGAGAVSPFIADTDFGTGTKTFSVTNTISTSGVANAAPMAVYQSERASDGSNGGAFTYTIPNLTANAAYTVRLHFAEIFYSTGGQRSMNVTINGSQVLTNYDIFNAAGGEFKANVKQYSTNANGSGQIAITFGGGGAKIDGIEVLH